LFLVFDIPSTLARAFFHFERVGWEIPVSLDRTLAVTPPGTVIVGTVEVGREEVAFFFMTKKKRRF
jgi:hypothetical protein